MIQPYNLLVGHRHLRSIFNKRSFVFSSKHWMLFSYSFLGPQEYIYLSIVSYIIAKYSFLVAQYITQNAHTIRRKKKKNSLHSILLLGFRYPTSIILALFPLKKDTRLLSPNRISIVHKYARTPTPQHHNRRSPCRMATDQTYLPAC